MKYKGGHLIKTDKQVCVKVRGKTRVVVREHYMRVDVPCLALGCTKCNKPIEGNGTLLPTGSTHFLIPFMDVALKYLEILEFPEITGIIFPQTVVQRVLQDGGRKLYKKLCNLIQDTRKGCVIFANEFCLDVYSSKQAGESLSAWQARNTHNVGVWYRKHLDEEIPIVMLTECSEIITQYEHVTDGVLLISLRNYLSEFWPGLDTALNIYDSLSALLEIDQTVESSSEYVDHLSVDILESGIKMGHYLNGIIRVNKHCAQIEAFVSIESNGQFSELSTDILIPGQKNRNRAIHGDMVAIEIFPRSEWQGRIQSLRRFQEGDVDFSDGDVGNTMPTGRVVGILQRNWRDYVVSLPQDEKFVKFGSQDRVLCIPFDYRIPKIRIVTRQAASLEGQRFVVRIDAWEITSQYPNGHFVQSLGKIGELATETETILVEEEISVLPFVPGVLKEMPIDTLENPWIIEPLEILARNDLRSTHLICSIDPEGCEDVDDALSVRNLPNDCIELGVHIADVTHFVHHNSYTDLDARSRGSTVYLTDRRYDMLPGVLSSNLCSLISGVDRFAVSVMWILDRNCNVVDVWYGQTVIRSSYKLFYEVAQEIIDGKPLEELIVSIPELEKFTSKSLLKKFQELKTSLSLLTKVAHVLKARRILQGALELDSSEVQVDFCGAKQDKSVKCIHLKKVLDIHSTVAECMIFANNWVAKKIKEAFPTHSLLRRHPFPRQDQFDTLRVLVESKGFTVDTSSNKRLAQSLDQQIDPGNPFVEKILRSVTVRAMNVALYFCTGSVSLEDHYHYGLALEDYTHFTSPIRRYADILVHRLLLAAVAGQESLLCCSVLQDVCDHLNKKQKAAKKAQQASLELFQTTFFSSIPETDCRRNAHAIIFSLRSNGFLVYVPYYGIKAPIYLKNKLNQVAFIKDNVVNWISGEVIRETFQINVLSSFGKQAYHLFDNVMVYVTVEKSYAHASSVKLELLNNCVYPELMAGFEEERLSRKELIKEVSSLQQKELESTAGSSVKNKLQYSDVAKKKSAFYLLIEELKHVALKQSI